NDMSQDELEVDRITNRLINLGYSEQQIREILRQANTTLFGGNWLENPTDALIPITSESYQRLDTPGEHATTRVILNGQPYLVVTEGDAVYGTVTGDENFISITTGHDGRAVTREEFLEAYRRNRERVR
ncbi:MAG: hypothetical protein ABH983_00630, partial [Candidatus Micrarchaeota archaeon]